MSRNNNKPNKRLGQVDNMIKNTQKEKQERIHKLLNRNIKQQNDIKISKNKEMDIVEFTENYLGFKLLEYQKILLKFLQKNNWNTIVFPLIHRYTYQSNMFEFMMLKNIIKE
jgi:hypothetical protein